MPAQAYRRDLAGLWIITGGEPPGGGGPVTPTAAVAGPSALEVNQIGTWSIDSNATPTGYQWSVNGVPVAGATLPTLQGSFPNATTEEVGCEVTFSGGVVVTATPVTVTVTATTFAGGWEINPDGSNVGLAGVGSPALTVTGTFDTSADGQVVDLIDTDGGFFNVRHDNVTLRRSRVRRNGTLYGIRFLGGSSLRIEDSDLQSDFTATDNPSSVVGPGSVELVRCRVGDPGTADLWKARSNSRAEDCWFGGLKRVDGGHHDAVQMEQNLVENVEFLRCRFEVFNGSDFFNAVIQLGGWGTSDGLRDAYVTNCYLNGGNYVIGGGLDSADVQGPFVFRGNRWGRDFQFGLFRNKVGLDVDASNVWADTLDPIPF